DERRDAEVGVVDRDARAVGLGCDLDLPRLDVGAEQLARGLLDGGNEVLDAALDQAEDAALDLSLLDVVEVQVEEELLAARADASGDDPAHPQRDAGAPQAGDVVEAL